MKRFLLVALLALCLWGAFREVKRTLFAGPYPAPVDKSLYASDFRGSAMPTLNVLKWLAPPPDTHGKLVLIDFWATWCGPCRATIPELNQLQKAFPDDLVVIGLGDETPDTINAFRKQTPMNYAIGTDPAGVTKKQLGVQGIPNCFLLSSDGVVRWQGIPNDPSDPLTAKTIHDILLADPAITQRHNTQKLASAK